MQLKPVATFETIDPEVFKKEFYFTGTPVVIKASGLAAQWPAYQKWTWDYFKQLVGNKKVPLYNNVKSDSYTPINKADDYKTFGEYIDMISKGPAAWRVFLFNIFNHAPELWNFILHFHLPPSLIHFLLPCLFFLISNYTRGRELFFS